MARASLNEFKLMLGGAAGVDNDALNLALSDARRRVIKDGVAESHEDFGELQRYWAGHLLVAWGQVNQSSVASETVGDVSRTFNTTSSSSAGGSNDGYQEKYRTLLVSVVGLKHKVA